MKMDSVQSTNLKAIGYEDGILRVEFLTSGIYDYKEVPEEVYNEMMEAESKGAFLASQIKNKFEFKRMDTKIFRLTYKEPEEEKEKTLEFTSVDMEYAEQVAANWLSTKKPEGTEKINLEDISPVEETKENPNPVETEEEDDL